MFDKVRAFLTVVEEGSVRRAAARLQISQPALSRQIQSLEHELGGPLLERTSTGVRPTHGGQALSTRLRPWLEQFEAELIKVRRLVRGEGERLSIGYLHSAADDYLTPAMRRFRSQFRDVNLKLFEMTPGEQIAGLRAGELDLVLTDGNGQFLSREFYVRRLANLPLQVAMAASHRLASKSRLRIADLRKELFVGTNEEAIPGVNRVLTRLCLKVGRFRPRTLGRASSLDEGLSFVTNDGAIMLIPSIMTPRLGPCTVVRPLEDPEATWDLMLAWRRGRVGTPLRALVDAFFAKEPSLPTLTPESRPTRPPAKRVATKKRVRAAA